MANGLACLLKEALLPLSKFSTWWCAAYLRAALIQVRAYNEIFLSIFLFCFAHYYVKESSPSRSKKHINKNIFKTHQINKCMCHIVAERVWPLINVIPVNNFAPGCNALLGAMQFQGYM